MGNRKLQIDVIGFDEDQAMVECKLIVDGRVGIFYMSKSNYEAFKFDGLFVGGKKSSTAGSSAIDTTHVFEEQVSKLDIAWRVLSRVGFSRGVEFEDEDILRMCE